MVKRNLEWTRQKYERFLKEKRGTGEGKDYKPWLNIQSQPSLGRVSRVYSQKTDRIHHFLSDMQTNAFYIFSFREDVIDIREHYPLLDVNGILGDLERYGLGKYTIDKYEKDKAPTIVTTTFLTTTKDSNGENRYIARSVKNSSELDRKYVIEMMELQRRYWSAKEIDWGIITQKEINKTKARNIEWALSSLNYDIEQEYSMPIKQYQLEDDLLNRLMNSPSEAVRDICFLFDKAHNIPEGIGIVLLRKLVASKRILIDMNSSIDLSKKVSIMITLP